MKICCRCKEEKNDNGFSKGQRACKQCYRNYYLSKTQRKCLECKSLCIGQRHMYCSNECKIIHNVIKQDSGCWEWQGTIEKTGYGATKDYDTQNKNIKVHRLSYRVFKGEIPEGLLVLHACDNRKCCNPKHLWLGTHHDNNQDCLNKGRWAGGCPTGEKNGSTELNDEIIKDIRKLAKKGVFQREIAKKWYISQPSVSAIVNRKTWSHVKDGGF